MNIILLIDDNPIWRSRAGIVSPVQRIIDSVAACRAAQRLVISATPSWTEDRQHYRVAPFTLPSPSMRSWIRYSSASSETQVYDIMRELCLDSAVVLSSATPCVFPFMLDEIFSGTPNKEYGLRSFSWAEVVRGDFLTTRGTLSDLQLSADSIEYAYSEVMKGAAWEEVMEEINGEQGSVSI